MSSFFELSTFITSQSSAEWATSPCVTLLNVLLLTITCYEISYNYKKDTKQRNFAAVDRVFITSALLFNTENYKFRFVAN